MKEYELIKMTFEPYEGKGRALVISNKRARELWNKAKKLVEEEIGVSVPRNDRQSYWAIHDKYTELLRQLVDKGKICIYEPGDVGGLLALNTGAEAIISSYAGASLYILWDEVRLGCPLYQAKDLDRLLDEIEDDNLLEIRGEKLINHGKR